MPVIAGTGANSTAEAIDLTREACDDGADACLSVVPYYNKPSQTGLLQHFTAIADASSKPVILYNVPARTITDLADNTLLELSEHERIVRRQGRDRRHQTRLRIQQKLISPRQLQLSVRRRRHRLRIHPRRRPRR